MTIQEAIKIAIKHRRKFRRKGADQWLHTDHREDHFFVFIDASLSKTTCLTINDILTDDWEVEGE